MPDRHEDSTQALGAGLTFAVTMVVFAFGGLWVDDRLGTRPLFLLLGLFLGLVGGTIHLLRILSPDSLPFGKRKGPRADRPAGPPGEEKGDRAP